MAMLLSCTDMEIRGFKNFGVTSLTFWGHVTSLVMWSLNLPCVFQLEVYCNHASILDRYGDMGLQIYWGHDLDLLGSRDGIDHLTIISAWTLSYWWSMMTMRLSCMDTKIRGFKDFGFTSLTFWNHVTSSVTWPLDSAYVVSYWWSIVTMSLFCIVTEIWVFTYIGVTTLSFWGHVTSSITWPSDLDNFLFVVSDDHAPILHE